MHALRTSRNLARLILGWFVLVLMLATASAIAHPKAMQVLCLGNSGTKLVMVSSETGEPVKASGSAHALDCPLCLTLVPPPAVVTAYKPPEQSAGVFFRVNAQRIARAPAPALPARGPPPLS